MRQSNTSFYKSNRMSSVCLMEIRILQTTGPIWCFFFYSEATNSCRECVHLFEGGYFQPRKRNRPQKTHLRTFFQNTYLVWSIVELKVMISHSNKAEMIKPNIRGVCFILIINTNDKVAIILHWLVFINVCAIRYNKKYYPSLFTFY